MQDREALHKICQDIVNDGLTPGVGLLRARAPFKVSLTQAIDAIKAFKQGKPAGTQPQTQQEAPPTTRLEERIAALESRVAVLEAQLRQAD